MTDDEMIQAVLLEGWGIDWGAESTERLPNVDCSKQFSVLRKFVKALRAASPGEAAPRPKFSERYGTCDLNHLAHTMNEFVTHDCINWKSLDGYVANSGHIAGISDRVDLSKNSSLARGEAGTPPKFAGCEQAHSQELERLMCEIRSLQFTLDAKQKIIDGLIGREAAPPPQSKESE